MTFMEAGKILDDFVIWYSGLTSVEADLLIESRFEVVFVFAAFWFVGGVTVQAAGGLARGR